MTMQKFLRIAFGWGFVLWLFGYVLGIVLFPFVPVSFIGWVIMPVGILLTLWVLVKKIPVMGVRGYLVLGAAWAVVAIVCDYLFLVRLIKPADGYYKPDVYLYYALTLLLPVGVGLMKNRSPKR